MASDRAMAYLMVVLGIASLSLTHALLALSATQSSPFGDGGISEIAAILFAPLPLVLAVWYSYKLTGDVL